MPEDILILVDEKDKETGCCPKLETHEKGLLHRAFSIFVVNSNEELILQKRAASKYHSANLWANTCCSHPRKGETLDSAIHRRLYEEMGFDCPLQEIGHFIYKAKVTEELWEHEYDHIFIGTFDGIPVTNPEEVAEYACLPLTDIQKDIENTREKFAVWFLEAFPIFLKYRRNSL